MPNSLSSLLQSWREKSAWMAIMVFPVFAAGAKGGATYPFAWLALLGLLWGWRERKALSTNEKRLFTGFLAFFLVIMLSLLLGSEFDNGVRRLEKYLSLLLAFPVYLAIRRFVPAPGKPFLIGLAVSPLGSLLFGISWDFERLLPALQLARPLEGYYATIILGDLAALFAILLLVALIVLVRSGWWLAGGGVLLLLGLLVVAGSGSRNAMLFVPLGLLAAVILAKGYLSMKHWAALGAALLLLSSVVVLTPHNYAVERVEKALTQLGISDSASEKDIAVSYRFEMWRDSITMWKEAPWLGVGLGAFQATTQRLVAEGRSRVGEIYGHAHSIYFDALATTGLVGLLAMVWWGLGRPLRLGWQAWRAAATPWATFYAATIVIAVVGFAVFGLTEAWFSRDPLVRSYLLVLLISLAGLASQPRVVKGAAQDNEASGLSS